MKIPSRGPTVGEILEESANKHAQWVKAVNGLVHRAKALNDGGVVVWTDDFEAMKVLLSEEMMRN